MKIDYNISFDHLVSLAEKPLEDADIQTLKGESENAEMLEGLQLLFEKESMSKSDLEMSFERMEKRLERKIYLHNSFSNHLIELNQQLRKAAAIFLIGISFSFLLLRGLSGNIEPSGIQANGPYDLVMGSKVAP